MMKLCDIVVFGLSLFGGCDPAPASAQAVIPTFTLPPLYCPHNDLARCLAELPETSAPPADPPWIISQTTAGTTADPPRPCGGTLLMPGETCSGKPTLDCGGLTFEDCIGRLGLLPSTLPSTITTQVVDESGEAVSYPAPDYIKAFCDVLRSTHAISPDFHYDIVSPEGELSCEPPK